MKEWLNPTVRQLQIPGIRHFSNLVSQFPHAINLTVGQPDFATPDHIKKAGCEAIKLNETTYTHNAGMLELRDAASVFMYKKYGIKYNPDSEILITTGASQGIDTAFRTILQQGDEVIIPVPSYPGYEPIIRLCGAEPVLVDTSENGFKLSVSMLEEAVTDKTKCILLNFPNNPTGVVLQKEELEELASFLVSKSIFVISDEIYSENIYEGKHTSFASLPGMRGKTIVINGVSKSHSMTGWRIGFLFAPKEITEEAIKVHSYNTICASTISQHAALSALLKGNLDPALMNKQYFIRRDYMFERLVNMGFEVVKPQGAFYMFPSIKHLNLASFDFAYRLLSEAGVAVVPGTAFSAEGEGYIRLSYASSLSQLEEGLNRIEKYVRTQHLVS
jgi:aminotransferase